MNKLVVHHTYVNNLAFDISNNRNHGLSYSVAQAAKPYAPSYVFADPDSRVIVPPSPSLQNLIALRAIATFNLLPPGGIVRRYNLIEGHLSFALFVESNGALTGTILDADGNWVGAQTAPNFVSTGVWHEAEIRHDGINQCVLLLDGKEVSTSYTGRGPVRTIGPHGIAIGHWPETPGVYTFEGYIREAKVYKFDPLQAAKDLLDPCCNCRPALDRTADRLRARGYTAAKAREQAMAMLNFALGTTAQIRGSDPAVSQQQANLAAVGLAAFLRGDSASYTTALAQTAVLAAGRLSKAEMEQIHKKEEELVKALPLPLKDWQELIDSMCWGTTKVDPAQLLSEYARVRDQSQKRGKH